jgi:hypothetical protein
MNIQGVRLAAVVYSSTKTQVGRHGSEDASSGAGLSKGTLLTLSDEAQRLALADSATKPMEARTAEEVDQLQRANGLVNTMALLSPSEKQLYNELVAKGDTEAVKGMNLLALSRVGGGEVTLPNGKAFNPSATEITPENIRNLFSQVFISADKDIDHAFNALARALEGRQSAAA